MIASCQVGQMSDVSRTATVSPSSENDKLVKTFAPKNTREENRFVNGVTLRYNGDAVYFVS